MEEKLVKLFLVAKEFSEESKKYYAEISIDFDGLSKLEIAIRNKNSHEFIEIREIYLEQRGTSKIDELVEFIKNYEV